MPDHRTAEQPTADVNPKLKLILACMLASCALPASALAADNPGAHEHGHAQLQIALEGNQVDVIFTSPAHNLAGFEHQARTEEQKNRLTDIRNWLKTTPLLNTTDRDCALVDASVLLGGSPESHNHHGHHEEHGHDDDHHHDEATHRDYEVTQQLSCEGITSDETYTSVLMKEFPGLKELDIEWVSATGQGSLEMTSPDMTFTLSP